MKNLLKKISVLVVGAMIMVTAIIYICPIAVWPNMGQVARIASNMCGHTPTPNINLKNIPDCLSAHLSLAKQLFGDSQNVAGFLLVLTLMVLGYRIFTDDLLAARRSLLSRFRYLYEHYLNRIKVLIEKKVLRYLGFVGGFTIASLV
ncbi:MAG: hypothetical protein HY980_03785 [Candidatus Magasanikbacteria bacterium]|nr:hypothetical protein [Candidatus Magasanikbacteria bacterium]